MKDTTVGPTFQREDTGRLYEDRFTVETATFGNSITVKAELYENRDDGRSVWARTTGITIDRASIATLIKVLARDMPSGV